MPLSISRLKSHLSARGWEQKELDSFDLTNFLCALRYEYRRTGMDRCVTIVDQFAELVENWELGNAEIHNEQGHK